MNGQGSDICIHNNNVCSLAPADRINVITSPRSAKAVEDAPFGPQDISPIKKHQQYIDRIVYGLSKNRMTNSSVFFCRLIENWSSNSYRKRLEMFIIELRQNIEKFPE